MLYKKVSTSCQPVSPSACRPAFLHLSLDLDLDRQSDRRIPAAAAGPAALRTFASRSFVHRAYPRTQPALRQGEPRCLRRAMGKTISRRIFWAGVCSVLCALGGGALGLERDDGGDGGIGIMG
jgi:hypothetical protein